MQAFLNDIKIKNKYLNRVMAHAEADQIIKGKYWEGGKGCAVGCTVHSSDHNLYETELGIPKWLALLEDKIFEGLPNDKAMEWPVKFLAAINIGADLKKIKSPFLIFVLEGTLDKFDHNKFPKVKRSVDRVIALYKDPKSTPEEFRAARSAAADFDAYAADADFDAASASAAATYAADVYAYESADFDAYAAYAYAAASYDDYARYDAYGKFADKLLELIGNCKDEEK